MNNKYIDIYNEILKNSDDDSQYRIHTCNTVGADLKEHIAIACDYKFNGYFRRCVILHKYTGDLFK